jgi:hydroxymethylpyrimidine kinase/phosphomethylpyrimidine kinase/thiamine-phosphate diphosphorylase
MQPTPIAWTINTSDSSSGDGLQSDLQTFHDFGVHGCTVVTAVTARNSTSTDRSVQLGPDVVEAQLRALAKDLPAGAVKSGTLGMTGIVRAVVKYMEQIQAPLVCDPSAASPTGMRQLDPSTLETVRNKLLPRSSVFAPNLTEAEWFSGLTGLTLNTMPDAARRLLDMGAASVLIKGGHLPGDFCQDLWSDGEHTFWITSPRIPDTVTTGAGGMLGAAITAALARSPAVADALVLAKAYVNQGLRLRQIVGKGPGLAGHSGFPSSAEDFPVVTATAAGALRAWSFKPLRFEGAPVMASAASAEQAAGLVHAGVHCVRFILDGMNSEKRAVETAAAAKIVSELGGRLFTHGHPNLAQTCGAHGALLTPDTATDAVLAMMESSGLLLGIEAHSPFELARALAWQPSWVQLDGANGPALFARLARLSDAPVVAASGASVENASSFRAAGAAGLLIDDDVRDALDPSYRVTQWSRLQG